MADGRDLDASGRRCLQHKRTKQDGKDVVPCQLQKGEHLLIGDGCDGRDIWRVNGSKGACRSLDTIFWDDTVADLNRRFNNNDRQGLYGTEYVLVLVLWLGMAWGSREGRKGRGVRRYIRYSFTSLGRCGNDNF